MTSGLMRKSQQSLLRHSLHHARPRGYKTSSRLKPLLPVCSQVTPRGPSFPQQTRCLANVRDDKVLSEVWFTGSFPRAHDPFNLDNVGRETIKPPDERTLKLGKTIRTLHDRLPTLLTSPLPTEVLSPQIKLHLFPTTHPHLPTVSGRIAYSAALWTAPVAWGRVPVVGNVRLIIVSERMVKNGAGPVTSGSCNGTEEKLVVRWKTCGKGKGRGLDTLFKGLYGRDGTQVSSPKMPEVLDNGAEAGEFAGLFIFEFDEEGRIVSHTIEHAQQGGNWEKTTRVVNVTDWLLGRARWGKKEPELALGVCEVEESNLRRRIHRARRDDG